MLWQAAAIGRGAVSNIQERDSATLSKRLGMLNACWLERSKAQISFPMSARRITVGKGELFIITHAGYMLLLVVRG
jgi:hypothetical protein